MNTLKLVTAPASLPLTLAQVKEHLRVQDSDEDTMLALYIEAATVHAESFMGRALIDQTWDYTIDRLPCNGGTIELPRQPLLGVTQFDTGDSPEFSDYSVDLASGRLYLPVSGSWPTVTGDYAVARIRFRAGYVDQSESPEVGEVPADILNGILLIVGTLYAVRETVIVGQTPASMPWSAEQLLRRHRIETSLA